MPRTTLLALSLTFVAPAAFGQGGACVVDLGPLVTVHASRLFEGRTLPGRVPPPPREVTEDLLVTNGGAASAVRVTRTFCCDIPDLRLFASGIAGRADVVRLRDLLAEVRVGLFGGCVFENDLTTPVGPRVRGGYEVTWYGRAGRRNRFTIAFADAGQAALPLCPPEAQRLIDGLTAFADALAADPDRVVCSTPPQAPSASSR
jgi:hypothetical protein